jgi:uncharacterized protein YggE
LPDAAEADGAAKAVADASAVAEAVGSGVVGTTGTVITMADGTGVFDAPTFTPMTTLATTRRMAPAPMPMNRGSLLFA